jgi:hypothetical protein
VPVQLLFCITYGQWIHICGDRLYAHHIWPCILQWRCLYQGAFPGNQIPDIKTSYSTDQHLREWPTFACECGTGNFEKLKQRVKGCPIHSNEEVQTALREWLQMHKAHFYHDRIFKLLPRWNKRISVPGDYVEKIIILLCN